jgi:hypothetical protein
MKSADKIATEGRVGWLVKNHFSQKIKKVSN